MHSEAFWFYTQRLLSESSALGANRCCSVLRTTLHYRGHDRLTATILSPLQISYRNRIKTTVSVVALLQSNSSLRERQGMGGKKWTWACNQDGGSMCDSVPGHTQSCARLHQTASLFTMSRWQWLWDKPWKTGHCKLYIHMRDIGGHRSDK